jgi:hypothetical protein
MLAHTLDETQWQFRKFEAIEFICISLGGSYGVRQPSIVAPSTTVLPMLRPRLHLAYPFSLMKIDSHANDNLSR